MPPPTNTSLRTTCHPPPRSRAASAFSLAILIACSACGRGDSGGVVFEGCGSDADCKGDRICIDHECVDPSGGGGGSGGDAADAATAGSGGTGAADGGTAAGADAGPAPPPEVIDDPLLEAACIADCEAKHAADCSMPIGSLDQCMGQCLVIDEYGHGYCRLEQRAHYACLAAGGYTCAAGYPQPKATCIAEATALQACNLEVPCRHFCDVGKDSCAPGGSMCFETCMADRGGFEDFVCAYDYDRLLTCWTNALVCNGDRPSVEGCEEAAAEVASCVGRRQTECDGFCWAADLLGCGSTDCVASCTSKTEQAGCGYQYEAVLRCAYQNRVLNMTCAGGVPVFTAMCDADVQTHETCVQNL